MEPRSKKTFLKAQPGIQVFYSDTYVLDLSGVRGHPGTAAWEILKQAGGALGGNEPDSARSALLAAGHPGMGKDAPARATGGHSPSHTGGGLALTWGGRRMKRTAEAKRKSKANYFRDYSSEAPARYYPFFIADKNIF